MPTGFSMEQVREYATQLVLSDNKVREAGRRSIKRGAVNVKRDARARIRAVTSGAYTRHYPNTIQFDILDDGLAAEIGSQKGRKQAFLGKILENGTSTSRPYPHLIPAAMVEERNLHLGMAEAVSRALAGSS